MANICENDIRLEKADETTFSLKEIEEIEKFIKDNDELGVFITSLESGASDYYMEFTADSRWNTPKEGLLELAKKFNVGVRCISREDGVGFISITFITNKLNITEQELDLHQDLVES